MTLTLNLSPELEKCLQERAAASGQDVGGFVRQLLEKELRFSQKELEQRFLRLLNRWRSETDHLSSSTQITGHAAYQEIIGLGREALPLLLQELERSHDGHLSKALTAITGARPVPPEDRGRIKKVAEAWLRWARETGQKW
jgi:hypothetical protein